jgi:hypothetical protein
LFVVGCPFSFFFSLFDVIIYIQKIHLFLYYMSIFPVFVYCPFSYFVFIFCSNLYILFFLPKKKLYIIFISVLKVIFFNVIYAKDRREKEYLLDINSSYTYEAINLL